MPRSRTPNENPDRLADVIDAVRALGIILNTRSVYNSSHPVFRRTLDDRIPVLRQAVGDLKELKFRFEANQVYYEQRPIDPGSDVTERLARLFEANGVRGVAFRPGVSAEDVAALADLLSTKQMEKEGTSLQALLKKHGVRTIVEFTPSETDLSAADSDTSAAAAAKATPGRTFELDFGSVDLGGGFETLEDEVEEETDQTLREYRFFVRDTVSSLSDNKRAVQQTTDAITFEFEVQLNRRIEEVKQQTESRIRRLENIKELMLTELEALNLAAILVDNQRRVLEANESGRHVIGELKQVPDDTPLGQFILSGREKQRIRINDGQRMANIIISERANTPEGAMLICLE